MIYHYTLFFLLASLLSLDAQNVPTPANIVCYQEVVASQGTYAQINQSLSNWSQRMYQTLGLTGPIELQVGWARVPDRTGFENGCNGPYPNIADLFVHIQTTSAQYDTVSSQLESFIAANRMTAQPNIVCSARSIVTFLPGCGKVGAGGAPPNNATQPPTNATEAPTQPANATLAPTTSAPTNATNTTEAPTTSAPTNATTELPTSAPTLPPSNETTSAPTNASTPTNATTTEVPTSTPTVPSNSTETNSSSSGIVAGAASDQSATGGITISGASSTMTTETFMLIPVIMGIVTLFQ